eukprot:m.297136 g.297136  ORF g.297136 m.297136 type:complete len:513 (-) comp20076_c0_seq1:197-1735(-)
MPIQKHIRDVPSDKRIKVILPMDETRSTPYKPWDALDMSAVGLHILTPPLFKMEFLTCLYLNQNNLSFVPHQISNLASLELVDLSHNKLRSLPREMGKLRKMQELLLFHNQLEMLPFEIGQLFLIHTLGLHGNPLAEPLRTYASDGTERVMNYLLDNVPISDPPPPREMLRPLQTRYRQGESKHHSTFTVFCYNVLCSKYATRQLYSYCPPWALEWDYRKENILKELEHYNADIILLQEVEQSEFYGYFQPELHQRGYEGVYRAKSRARTMGERDRKFVDGCAIFFRCAEFTLHQEMLVEFERLASSVGAGSQDMLNRVMPKDNIAVGVILKHVKTGKPMFVGNAHLTWDPVFKDVKVVQAALLVNEVNKFIEQYEAQLPEESKGGPRMPVVLGGDFNSEPSSGVYELLATGRIGQDHPDLEDRDYKTFGERVGFDHKLNLKSVYTGEMPYTNYTHEYKGIIDYVFYSADRFAPTELLGPVDAYAMREFDGCPNPHFASDHLPLFGELAWTD